VISAPGINRGLNAGPVQSRALPKAAAQFEAVLLETLIGGLQKTFSSLGGENDFGVSGTYDYFGTQALAAAWAQSGGIGLARMIRDKFK
jgi:Rod binding domain-containing protein